MDHNVFSGQVRSQDSQNSAEPLVIATQTEEPAGGLTELKQSESPFHKPATKSFSSQDNDSTRDEELSHSTHPLPPLPLDVTPLGSHPDPRARPLSGTLRATSIGQQHRLDWINPREENGERAARERTVGERLDPTLLTAITERDKYAFKARLVGYALNAAIGLQVFFGTLTTGLAVVVSGHKAQVSTAVLGGFSTLVASFLARARGSNEPELSITRVKDLEQFIRECQAFKMDYGHVLGDKHDNELHVFRNRFEELLGNANGERRLSPPV